MEKFEVYNRKLNKWDSENISIVPGWSENWVLDKTTDTMSIKLKYKSTTEPNFNVGDWCRILHAETPTYEGINIKLKNTTEFKEEYEYIKSISSVIYDANIGTNGGFIISQSENVNKDVEYTLTYAILKNDRETPRYAYLKIPAGSNSVTHFILPTEIFIENATGGYYIGVRLYEQAYKPLNHEQYIIGDITLVENKIAGEWDCQLKLKEPIEITSGILCETMSFTNQISKTVDGVVYTHEPLNHLSVLEKILKVTPANNDLQKSWWSRIKICHQAFLENIAFNDETYSEPSLYNILMDKYDSSVGRTPVLYFDINPETDLPNDLKRETYILDFERQDGFDKEDIELTELTNGHNEIIINKSDENFTDGLVSNYDNLTAENEIVFPQNNTYATPEVNTSDRDLTKFTENGVNSEWILRVPHLIKDIKYVKKLSINQELSIYKPAETSIAHSLDNVIITNEINNFEGLLFEKKQYDTQSDEIRNNAIWYEEGTNIIHLNDLKYSKVDDGHGSLYDTLKEKSYVYQITYNPLISGRYDLGKDYQTPINQVDSQIDSRKFGDYLKNYFASMNKADIIVQKTVDNFADIKEVGTRVIDGDKTYIITNVSIQNRGYDYEVIYQLNENHIRKSDTIVAPQEIRKNIEIGINSTKERKSMLNFEYYLSLTGNKNTNIKEREFIYSSLLSNSNVVTPSDATITIYSKLNNTDYSISRSCGLAKYIINDTFCLNLKFFDNAEAGKSKTLDTQSFTQQGVIPKIATIYGMPNSQIPVLYTDYFGEFQQFRVDFYGYNADDISLPEGKTEYGSSTTRLSQIGIQLSQSANNPISYKGLGDSSGIVIDNINYYKDMLDNFNYTIGYHINADKNIILCQNFFKNSLLMTKNGAKISYIETYDKNITENDYNVNNFSSMTKITSILEDDGILITLNDELSVSKSIVLVDTNNNPILIINDFDKIQTTDKFKTIKLYC